MPPSKVPEIDLTAVNVSDPLLAGRAKARFMRAAEMGELKAARSATTCVDFMFAGTTVKVLKWFWWLVV
jgi:hypothetical protein